MEPPVAEIVGSALRLGIPLWGEKSNDCFWQVWMTHRFGSTKGVSNKQDTPYPFVSLCLDLGCQQSKYGCFLSSIYLIYFSCVKYLDTIASKNLQSKGEAQLYSLVG